MSHFLSGQAEGEEVINGQEVENGPVAQLGTPSRQGQIPKISSSYIKANKVRKNEEPKMSQK